MSKDARFADGADRALKLRALDSDDLAVISSLAQDAVLTVSDMLWQRGGRRFAVLLNRFRWEDSDKAVHQERSFERVRSMLVLEDVQKVQSQGIDLGEKETVLSLLSIQFEPGEDGTGRVVLTFAGDGAVAVEVEALEAVLQDVTQPYSAPSGRVPSHGE
jgi:hypothetical protein